MISQRKTAIGLRSLVCCPQSVFRLPSSSAAPRFTLLAPRSTVYGLLQPTAYSPRPAFVHGQLQPTAYSLQPTVGGLRAAGFTLIELLVAVALLGMAMAMTFTTFYSVAKAWQRGTAMADDLDHGEYVMQQIFCGLRSSFFPPSGGQASSNAVNTNAANTNAAGAMPPSVGSYGFVMEDHGNGVGARDVISWVKTGTALLKVNDPLSKGLHRVRLSIEDDGDAGSAVAVRAWRPYANSITFDPMEIDPHFVSGKVVGMDCRVAKEMKDDKWDWTEIWEEEATNRLPLAVEITLYMEPLDRNEPPVEIRRTIEIPLAPWSWNGVPKQP